MGDTERGAAEIGIVRRWWTKRRSRRDESLLDDLLGAVRYWFRRRDVWFWGPTSVVLSVLVLLLGGQISRWIGQDVNWYAGFGQWLGALGSIVAAVAALWIATTDRKRADLKLAQEKVERNDDRRREARLGSR